MQLVHPDRLNDPETRCWYELLNEDPEFQNALGSLQARILAHRGGLTSSHAMVTLLEFAQRWSLGRHGYDDLFWTLWAARPSRTGLRLDTDFARGGAWPDVGQPVAELDADALPEAGVDARRGDDRIPLIVPRRPPPFRYDPTCMAHAALVKGAKAAAKRVYDDCIRQGELYEQQVRDAGWTERAARRRPTASQEASMRKCAMRLYLRLLRRMSWQQIARAERPNDPRRELPTTAIRNSVARWAHALGIVLPADTSS
jgi:hypothetical protein